ncbi:hydrolase, carbon-nitrogen family [Synechococcus sp. PCC 7335]|uniref:Nit6803 family nitrilase n=1 Tax=Synechococcus sp. (strain ATCC 29403 / PCC 7335) TaxID=91464 RepID=UPI00017EC432|nr:Nit6803 family nitrilase [Synechococcus sp. PCC 7335]EDX87476.1 hydrolase, carbon-nitrogen family [Synechococcus sp. PCC 7335]
MDYSKTVKAAAVQLSPVLHSQSGTVEKVLKAIGEAAKEGVDLIVFPETFIPYYPYFSFVLPPVLMGKEHMRLYEEAVVVPGPVTDAVGQAARVHQMVIVLGVNERDKGSLYNTQLVFDATGECVLKRRKLTPTYHERMVWGQGDGSGLQVCETAVGRLGTLACWEHYNPLARYSLMTGHEQIHCGQFPGSMVGDIFSEQTEVTMRHHALESGCFVVNSTGWLSPAQVEQIAPTEALQKVLQGGCYTTIISPEGVHLAEPIREGEGMAIASLDFSLITKRKRMMDSVGHYARPDLLQLKINTSAYSAINQVTHEKRDSQPLDSSAVEGLEGLQEDADYSVGIPISSNSSDSSTRRLERLSSKSND